MRIVFMGTPQAAVPTLRRCVEDGHEIVAVWTQPDRPSGRGKRVAQSPVKEFALAHGLTVHQPQRIKNDEAKQLFASHDADVAVVVAYGRILPGEFLRTPSRGCINVHFSLLPRYRGAAPANWAIVNGDQETGVTTMFIEPTLDTGPILLQRATQIGPAETAPELMLRLSEIGAESLSETLANLDNITPKPQDDSEATFAPILKKEDGLIDWTKQARAIEYRIRGLQPWPNAYTSFNARGLTIWRAEPLASANPQAGPGEVISAHGDDLIVQCGDGTALRLLELQPESRKRMTGREFLAGKQLKVGDRLGKA
ncbi:MAG TPA: methionyl-tRNA formyltransferase [Pyrinomonadaceae bacterium]|jgi:methionyl-tRNA formyltransferase|nr:methionyl-tRNA formyltransferase [Pyrinomonadaceae bacterium]